MTSGGLARFDGEACKRGGPDENAHFYESVASDAAATLTIDDVTDPVASNALPASADPDATDGSEDAALSIDFADLNGIVSANYRIVGLGIGWTALTGPGGNGE